jgi:hypothetical protein
MEPDSATMFRVPGAYSGTNLKSLKDGIRRRDENLALGAGFVHAQICPLDAEAYESGYGSNIWKSAALMT